MSSLPPRSESFDALAKRYGIQLSYTSIMGSNVEAQAEFMLPVLQALGCPIKTVAQADEFLKNGDPYAHPRVLEPVLAFWDDEECKVPLRLNPSDAPQSIACVVELESGDRRDVSVQVEPLQRVQGSSSERREADCVSFCLGDIPNGYHRLYVEVGNQTEESLIIRAPRKFFFPDSTRQKTRARPEWGFFAPLYSLRTQSDWGIGDLGHLRDFRDFVGKNSGNVVGTLPLFSTVRRDQTIASSPYAPYTKLFWNEIFLDIPRLPEFQACKEAKDLYSSVDFQEALEKLRSSDYVSYEEVYRIKRRILNLLAQDFFNRKSRAFPAFQSHVREDSELERYARHRADNAKTDSEGEYRYQLYTQWRFETQLKEIKSGRTENGVKLYLDFPLGVMGDSYDMESYGEHFVRKLSTGAPPDDFFAGGQNWGFHPPHPFGQRENSYSYFRKSLQRVMRVSDILRFDHVMAMHRLYVIGEGLDATQGVYLQYPQKELYAILSLESNRNRTVVVGEDLGTVPEIVRKDMQEHSMLRMYMLQFEFGDPKASPIHPVPKDALAGTNTHDMPPFTSYLHGKDFELQKELGFIDEVSCKDRKKGRLEFVQKLKAQLLGVEDSHLPDSDRRLFEKLVEMLSSQSNRYLVLNIEDAWQEERPQNFPGTSDEYPNWKRKMRFIWAQICKMPEVLTILRTLNGNKPVKPR